MLVDKYPNWDFSYNALAISLKERGNYIDAAKYFSKAIIVILIILCNASCGARGDLYIIDMEKTKIEKAQ